jgi:hypothetical protein
MIETTKEAKLNSSDISALYATTKSMGFLQPEFMDLTDCPYIKNDKLDLNVDPSTLSVADKRNYLKALEKDLEEKKEKESRMAINERLRKEQLEKEMKEERDKYKKLYEAELKRRNGFKLMLDSQNRLLSKMPKSP